VPGQAQISYAWDDADRLLTITQGSNVVTFDYDNANRRTKLTYPSATSTEYAYDNASRLTGLTYKHGGNTLGALTYAYDTTNQRTQVGGSWARTNRPNALVSATYNAGNQQTAFGGQTLTYDLNGNLTGDGTNSYTWNARNQLASLTGPVAGSFVYDAFGRRQRKTIDGTIMDFVYDGLNPVRQAVGAGTVDLLTGLGIDEYLMRTDSSSSRDFLSDALGSTVSLSDSSGTIHTEYSYEPFGAATASGSTSANELRYTGREDDGTGMNYYRARYYYPGLARFVSEDPIGLVAGDVNFYAYVANNPLSFIDPFGLDKDQCSAAGGGALASAANFSAGFGDILTSGLGLSYAFGVPSGTEAIRGLWLKTPGLPTTGAPDVVNPKCSWAYTSGQVAGAADAIAIAGLSTAAVAAGLQTRVAIHGAHHTFGPLGRLAHLQLNWWRAGVKGSGGVFRIPLPWR
jgi:RHS repeat-associated protein